MQTFAANLSMQFTEHAFLQRFGAAADAGFSAVEYLFPYDYPGERGIASLPGREQEFIDGIGLALEYAAALQCPRIHVMAGLINSTDDRQTRIDLYLQNLQRAQSLCAAADIELLIEPINPINMPGYLLDNFNEACGLIEKLQSLGTTVKLQFDIFHCKRIHDDVVDQLARCKAHIAHFQIAGTPDRHEPDNGDLPYRAILKAISDNGLEHLAMGCEYHPAGATVDGLGWLQDLS